MGEISHVFFDLHGTLIDTQVLFCCYGPTYGRIMAARYGLTPAAWTEANRRITADWDSYYADLDLDGQNSLDDLWEGLYRVTRAMFRITGVKEPDRDELTSLSRWIPGEVPKHCNALYADVQTVLHELHEAGFVLGVVSHALVDQAKATLIGGKINHLFHGPIIGPDVVGHYRKDQMFYRYAQQSAQVDAEQCLVVDDHQDALDRAVAIGMKTYNVKRDAAVGLRDLPSYIKRLR